MIKDKKRVFSTIAAIIMGIAGSLGGLQKLLDVAGYPHFLPSWFFPVGIIITVWGAVVIGALQGLNNDLSKKTPEQLNNQVNPPTPPAQQ